VIIVGGLIALSNYLALSGPSVMIVGLMGIALFLIGVAWLWRLLSRLRALKANPPVAENSPSSSASANVSYAAEPGSEHAPSSLDRAAALNS
jgi:xanthosine utilization system XapX-like protein